MYMYEWYTVLKSTLALFNHFVDAIRSLCGESFFVGVVFVSLGFINAMVILGGNLHYRYTRLHIVTYIL